MAFFSILTTYIEKITNAISQVIYFNILSPFGITDIDLPFVIALLFFGYIFLSFKLRFIQFTKLKYCFKYAFGKKKTTNNKKEISSLKTLFASIASCTGMNSVAGMVFMVAVGGPGTAFWMPIIAFICMPFRFAEVYLSHSYRETTGGEFLGGPFDYIKKGLKELNFVKLGKILAFSYAFIMVFSGTTGLALYETNQFVSVISGSFKFLADKQLILTIILVCVVFVILSGGTTRILKVLGTILPIIAIMYISVSLIVIMANANKIGSALILIVEDALHPRAIAGGFLASFCICARKFCLANETGMGTAGIVHSSSSEKDSVKEATSAMMTPLISCFCVCMMSAFVLIITGFYQDESTKLGSIAIFNAFGSVNKFFPYIITILVPMLAFNVLLGWSNYVIKCATYCFKKKIAVKISVAIFLVSAFIGGNINDFNLIMQIVDSIMMLLIIINVPIICILSGKVYNKLKEYKFR